MKLVSTRDFRQATKSFFDLAENEKVAVKRSGNKYVRLIVTDEPDKNYVDENWIKEFMAIPSEFRCNPFDVSPSGDLYFADKRNLDAIEKGINDAKNSDVKRLTREDQEQLFKID